MSNFSGRGDLQLKYTFENKAIFCTFAHSKKDP